MSKRYFSPRLKDDKNPYPDPSDCGAWTQSARGSLADLGASFLVTNEAAIDEVRSIPDPWAQPVTFIEALITRSHPQHDQAVAQWRGMLALFALEARCSGVYSLVFEAVDLRTSSTVFARVLRALPPNLTLSQKTHRQSTGGPLQAEWLVPVLVRVKQPATTTADSASTVVAMLNPACLVGVTRGARELVLPGLPWVENGLGDPTKFELTLAQVAVIRTYVETLKAGVEAKLKGRADPWSALNTQFDEYLTALGPKPVKSTLKVKSGAVPDDGLAPLYRGLRVVMTVEGSGGQTESDCVVKLRSDLGAEPPFKGAVLVDEALASTLSKAMTDIHVWEDVTLAEACASPQVLQSVRTRAGRAGYCVLTPDDLFTEQLVVLAEDGEIKGNPDNFRRALAPLSPAALLLIEPSKLKSLLSVSGGDVAPGGDNYSVGLTLVVRGAGDIEHAHAVSRTFTRRPTTGKGRVVDGRWGAETAMTWPNFVMEGWQNHFARISHADQSEDLHGRFGLSGQLLAAALSQEPEAEKRAVALMNWTRASYPAEPTPIYAGDKHFGPVVNRERRTEAGAIVELQYSRVPFEAMFYQMGGAAGLALLVLQHLPRADRNEIAAVDFGTTNTVACFRDREPIVFKDRLVRPIRSADEEIEASDQDSVQRALTDFFPLGKRATPTPSVAMPTFGDRTDRGGVVSEAPPLFRDAMYFPATGALVEMGLAGRTSLERAIVNLKWARDHPGANAARTLEAAGNYLHQLMMAIAAEAAAQGASPNLLEWRFSRPDALDDDAINFRAEVREKLKQIAPGADDGSNVKPLYSEGLAAATFMLGASASGASRRGSLDLVLDIGGGTTDVVFWKKKNPVWRGSYKLAGGRFFTDYLRANTGIFSDLGLPKWGQFVSGVENNRTEDERAWHFCEILLSDAGLAEALKKNWSRLVATPAGQGLEQSAFIFLAGIMHYLGLVAAHLIADGKLNLADLDKVTVSLCGRGAGLFALGHPGEADEPSAVRRLLTLFTAAAGQVEPKTPLVFRSDEPKQEVISGMVAPDDDMNDYDLAKIPRSEPLGLGASLGELQVPADALRKAFAAAPGNWTVDLAELDNFLVAARTHARLAIRIDQKELRTNISNAVEDKLTDAAKLNEDGVALGLKEPLFISALRVLVEDLSSAPGSRKAVVRRVTVER